MTPRSLRRFVSRISFRVMAFNLLLVFLPLAGVLYLGSYESKLLGWQRRSLEREARLLSAAVSAAPNPWAAAENTLLRRHRLRKPSGEPARLRVISPAGTVVADSHELSGPPEPQSANRAKRNLLYRGGAAVARWFLALLRATEPALPEADYYERSERLLGEEVRSALEGEPKRVERISPDRRSVTVYVAEPIRAGDRVIGAVLASQSTFTILQDLYTVRLGILRIFLVSVLAAVAISFFVATTIVQPLRELRAEAAAILDRRGRLRGRFRGSRKRDELGDLSRALERLTRRLDERASFIESFAADVSHEFRNPLASIRTATEMLAEVEDPSQKRRFLSMVEHEIARMESLLSGVREITLIDSQIGQEQRARVDLRELVTAVVDGFQLRERSRVEIVLETGDAPLMVNASPDRLTQVFVNVLENAVSFSPPGGAIALRLWSEGGQVIASIADRGPGIPESNLPRVFDRFFTQRPVAAGARSSHTGLGLAIVKAIVEAYEGTVTGRNAESGGAVFEIRLPAA